MGRGRNLSNKHLTLSDVLSAFNHGGETHTFAELDEFGGGFVDQINQVGRVWTHEVGSVQH